jgi:hypothetical protein
VHIAHARQIFRATTAAIPEWDAGAVKTTAPAFTEGLGARPTH